MLAAAEICKRLTRDEQERSGLTWPRARNRIAEAVGLAPGTLENLERGRLKSVNELSTVLCLEWAKRLKRKIAHLETELVYARATSGGLDTPDILGAEAAIASAQKCLGGRK